jgi:dihydroxyacetone kinase-like predicted kinase
LITIYYGENIAQDDAENLAEIVRTHYPEQDIELAYGGQPHYHYVLSTE